MSEFKATTFEELFQGTKAVNWGEIIPLNGFMHVTGKSIKSTLYSVPDCQSIVKKAVIESMKAKYNTDIFPEDGVEYKIEVGILNDIVTLTIDTTGPGLHKRGYRKSAGEAPIKETLAAALIMLTRWDPSKVLADPLCGSGTIAIEAALIGKNIAPGLYRNFISEQWEIIPQNIWADVKKHAKNSINDKQVKILASDIDSEVIKTAKENALDAGVDEYITFERKNVRDFTCEDEYGYIITNPPYGERIGEAKDVEQLYKTMGKVFKNLDTWSYYLITSYPEFEKYFGKKANKNRKLYNGKLQCYYYQYFGPRPKFIK